MWDNDVPNLDRDGLRRFGLTTGAIVVGLFGLALPLVFSKSLPYWPWYSAGVLALLAIAQPGMLQPVYRGWMRIGLMFGFVNTRIILLLLFYCVFVPAGLAMKLIGRDRMNRSFSTRSSYRVESDQRPQDHFERPY